MSGGAGSARKGTRYEQELVRFLHAAGWGSLRLPSSGSATERDLPDVLAGKPIQTRRGQVTNDIEIFTNAIAVELKSGRSTTLYVDAEEADDLRAFAERWGATPYLGARSTQQGTDTRHYLISPGDARPTDAGTYGLPVAELEERASVIVGPDGVERRE